MNESCNEGVFSGAEVSILKGIFYKLLTEGDYTAAAAIAKSLFEITAEDGEQWSLYGIAHKIGGNPETTREQRNRAQSPGGNKAAARADLAIVYQKVGDDFLGLDEPARAVPYLEKAVQLDPDFGLAHYDLGLAYVMLERYEEGAEAAKAALRDDPEMKYQKSNLGLGATGSLGQCLLNQGKLKEALECFKKNVALLGGTYFNMGLTLLRMDRREEAVESFTRAVEISPNDPEYLNLLGQAYGELGKVKEAEAYLQRALEIDSKYALGYYDLGVILAKQRTRDREAKRFFDKAIELDPEMAWAYYSIACLDALAGKKGVALKNLERAFEKGVEDKAHIDKDTDLDSIRKEAGYVKLMEKYFGSEEAGQGGE